MRSEVKDRFYRTFTYQSVDRVPDIEFGYWPQTIRRWLKEGMPLELDEDEKNQMFSGKVDSFFGFEGEGVVVGVHAGMHPAFEKEVLEQREGSVIIRDPSGVIAQRYKSDAEDSPHASSLTSKPEFVAQIPVSVVWPARTVRLSARKCSANSSSPAYKRVMTAARKRGCVISMVDCDGNPHDIVSNWLEEGVNIMFPLEVAAGCDPYAWREEFGMDLRIRGAIAKKPLVEGGAAIDRELERIKPLLEQGGFIPHLDHLVPPDIPYSHYCYYLDRKRKLIDK